MAGHDQVKEKKQQHRLQQEWIHEHSKLSKRYDVIEKQLQSIYRDGNPLSLELKDIFDWGVLMHSQRTKKLRQQHMSVHAIAELVQKFERLLQHLHVHGDVNMGREAAMNAIADEIEDALMRFKEDQQRAMKELDTAENTLYTELCTTNERLQSKVSAPSDGTTLPISSRRVFNQSENDSRPPKLIEIEKRLDAMPKNGGWSERDHSDFLKLYVQITKDKELLHRLSEIMPHYSLSQLRTHLEWFDQFERLREQKRDIIEDWKSQKTQMQTQKHEKMQHSQAKSCKQQTERQRQMQAAQMKKQQMVKEWREQKEEERHEEMRAKEKVLKMEKLRQQNMSRERIKQQKEILLQYKERQKLNEFVTNATKQTEDGSSKNLKNAIKKREQNEKLRLKFQTKDMLLISRKKEAINQKQQYDRERATRLNELIARSQPIINVQHDKQRLMKLTQSMQQREKEKKEQKQNNRSCNAEVCQLNIAEYTPARSVPSWRQGI